MRSIKQLKNLKGKTALVRVDFNIASAEDSLRLVKSLPTIKYLKKQGAKVVLISHRGQPKGKVVPDLSLKSIAGTLKKYIRPVVFLPDYKTADKKIEAARAGTIFLLENIRFYKGEEQLDKGLARKLAKLGDFYVNDAFSVSHRRGASLTLLPKLLPAYAGFLLQEEIEQLSSVMKKPRQPLVVILAGGKASDKFSVIENLYPKVDQFLIAGVLANTFFKSQGMAVDASVIDEKLLGLVQKYFFDKKITLPMDWLSEASPSTRSGQGGKIVDIGPMTRKYYSEIIEGAGTIIWSGPLGIFEEPRFRQGSAAIARAVADSKAFTVVGGGETTQLILMLGLEKEIDFLSTGGGAMLAFLAGKRLPALDALR